MGPEATFCFRPSRPYYFNSHAFISRPYSMSDAKATMASSSSPPPPPTPPLTPPYLSAALSALSGAGGGAGSSGGGHPSAPNHIKQAEAALLTWEAADPDAYASALLSTVYSDDASPSQHHHQQQQQQQHLPTIIIPVPRLAALLSLKACVSRKWKDRGRGARALPRRHQDDAAAAAAAAATAADKPKAIFLSDATKDLVRYAILSLVVGQPISQEAVALPPISPTLLLALSSNQPVQSACTSLLSKVGRLDLPMQFHALIPTLIGRATSLSDVSAGQMQMCDNSLDALDAILAELCDKRLLLDKKYVSSMVTEHLATLARAYVSMMGRVGTMLSSQQQQPIVGWEGNLETKLSMRYVVGMTSVLHRLLQHSLPAAQKAAKSSQAVDQIYEVAVSSIPALWGMIAPSDQPNQTPGERHEMMASLLNRQCRMVIDVQRAHPIEFGKYLGAFLQLFYDKFVELSSNTALVIEEDTPMEQFVLHAMTFLANVVGCAKYEPDESTNAALEVVREGHVTDADGTTRRTITSTGDAFATSSTLSVIEQAVRVVWSYFTAERMGQLCDIVLRRHMIMSPSELALWDDDGEQYFHADDGRSAEDDVGTCAQALYLALVESKAGKGVIAPRVVSMLQDVESQAAAAKAEAQGSHISESVLFLDAVYLAAGISLNAVEDGAGFSFASFFDGYLLPCLEMLVKDSKESSNLPILRHRIVWLIASNTFSVPVESRPRLYEVVLTMIVAEQSRQNDIVVKLTAAQVLNNSLFDRDESLVIFKNHSIISGLYRLTIFCEQYESRSLVLSCVSFVLVYLMGCGTMSEATANAAVGPLPQLWESSINENALLKRDVLSILSSIAQAVGSDLSLRLHPIALPMLEFCFDPSLRDDNLFLENDALGLWLALLRLSPAYSDSLGALFPRAQALLEADLDQLKTLMMTTECYILLGGAMFLNTYAEQLQKILVLIVGNVSPRGASYVALVLEALLRSYPNEGGQLMLQAGIFKVILNSCRAYYNEERDCEPDQVISLYLTALARAVIASPRILDHEFTATEKFSPNELILLYFRLFNQGSSSSEAIKRRLWALMMISLLPPTRSLYGEVLGRNVDKVASVCKTTQADQTLVPFEVGYDYDDEEETFVAGLDNYKALLQKAHSQDVAVTTNFQDAVQRLQVIQSS